MKGKNVTGRNVKGRNVKGRNVKGRNVKGRNVKGTNVKSRSPTTDYMRYDAMVIMNFNKYRIYGQLNTNPLTECVPRKKLHESLWFIEKIFS